MVFCMEIKVHCYIGNYCRNCAFHWCVLQWLLSGKHRVQERGIQPHSGEHAIGLLTDGGHEPLTESQKYCYIANKQNNRKMCSFAE